MKEKKKKVGLVLSGGAARGLAHVGVLRALVNADIPIDIITGTSIGSIVGATYAWDKDIARITKDALAANWKRLTPLLDPTFPRSGLLRGNKIHEFIAELVGGKETRFEDLQIPFACVATDIDCGDERVLNEGSVADAVRASISLPGIFTPVLHKDCYLVDGGLTTPIPVDLAREMGADFIIAVNVTPDIAGRLSGTNRKRIEAHKQPNIFQILMQSVYITTYSLSQAAFETADVGIEPDLGLINLGDFNQAREAITIGRKAAEAAIPEIREKLAK